MNGRKVTLKIKILITLNELIQSKKKCIFAFAYVKDLRMSFVSEVE